VIIDHGLHLADTATPSPVACYLESSPEGRPIYERKGFEVVRVLEVESAQGGGKTFGLPVMVRPAQTASGGQDERRTDGRPSEARAEK
jgi:hypothetical protein